MSGVFFLFFVVFFFWGGGGGGLKNKFEPQKVHCNLLQMMMSDSMKHFVKVNNDQMLSVIS